MFRKNLPPEPDAALEGRVRDLVSPLAGAAPANPAAGAALHQALHRTAQPRPHGLRSWQRAAVGIAGVFVPLFAVGSVAGLGGATAVTGSLDAVAGVLRTNGGAGGEGTVLALEHEDEDEDEDVTCAAATADARVQMEALLESGTLGDSATAGVEAALATMADCGGADGAEACLEATATAREVLQALLDTETLTADGRAGIEVAIEAIDACGSGDDGAGGAAETTAEQTPAAEDLGGGTGTGHETCFEATAHARDVLQSLLDDEDRPEQSKKGLERALEALENCGTGNDSGGEDPAGAAPAPAADPTSTPATQPAAAVTISPDSGNTVTIGKPENPGNSGDHKPANPGSSAAAGKPDTAGPGVGVSVGSQGGGNANAGGNVDTATLPGNAGIHAGGKAGAGAAVTVDELPLPGVTGIHAGGNGNATAGGSVSHGIGR